jgi:hypothetical protein
VLESSLGTSNNGWMLGIYNGRAGWFPQSHVCAIVAPAPNVAPWHRKTADSQEEPIMGGTTTATRSRVVGLPPTTRDDDNHNERGNDDDERERLPSSSRNNRSQALVSLVQRRTKFIVSTTTTVPQRVMGASIQNWQRRHSKRIQKYQGKNESGNGEVEADYHITVHYTPPRSNDPVEKRQRPWRRNNNN